MSKKSEYNKKYNKEHFSGIFPTKHYVTQGMHKGCKGCMDISYCQRLEWFNREGCEAWRNVKLKG